MNQPYDRIRALFPDNFGLARGKYIPTEHADKGARHCITMYALAYDRSMVPTPGARLLEGLPDCDLNFSMDDVRPGWEENTGVVVGDLSFRGAPLAMSARQVLKQALADWKTLGYTIKAGIELEAYVMQPDGNGGWTDLKTPGAYVYGTGLAVDPTGLFDEIMRVARQCGFPVEAINSEYDTPQFELTLAYGDVLEAIDNIFLFKLMAREIAQKRGLMLTFLGKPFADRSGSGVHLNFSIEDSKGDNALADSKSQDGLSTLAHQCIAGMLAHHQGMSAVCAPTVNAYKRLRPGSLAGYWANWGYDHRGVTIRVPVERGKGAHLEHRMSDGAANPYLATAIILQAARLGVVNKLTPPAAEDKDGLENISTDVHVPSDLNQALTIFEADTELVKAIGEDFAAQFITVKRAEWDKFAAAVTDWEINYYMPFI